MPSPQPGHRERLRKRFQNDGFKGFHDYEALEFLLTFIFRQGDVKPLSKALIKSFGSFSNVLDASAEDLRAVKGMGVVSALNLHAFRELMAFYFQDKTTGSKIQLTKMSALVEMLRAALGHKHNEILLSIFLNAKNDILLTREMAEGTVAEAAVFPRKLVEEAIKQKATSVIIAHNHPGGIAEPSDQDIKITQDIQRALASINISLQDHIILANDKYFSFKRNDLL